MWLRANVVLAVAVVFAVVQMFASVTGGPPFGGSGTVAGVPDRGLSQRVSAQEEDDDNDDEDNDDDDDDNEGDEDDNTDEDNADDDGDNCDTLADVDGDNVDCEDDDDDNDDEDDDNDDEDDDNDDEDDDNDDSDNDDSDNDDDDADNAEDADDDNEADEDVDDAEPDNVGADQAAATATPVAAAADGLPATPTTRTQSCAPNRQGPAPVPGSEVQGVTTGRDLLLAIPGDRLSVQVYASTPAGICLTLGLVDPLEFPAAPGVRAGSFIFRLEAFVQSGVPLSPLPAEVTLNVQYSNTDVAGLDESLLTFSRLDPLDQTWKITPNVLVDPATNWVWVSVPDTGIYVVHVP